jgi:hypothetical protein
VLEVDPTNLATVWQYGGTADRPLQSLIRSSQERLANGNTLITESSGGRIVEVTRDGTVVWEYINPIRAGDGDRLIPIICWAQRIDDATVAAALGTVPETASLTDQETKP